MSPAYFYDLLFGFLLRGYPPEHKKITPQADALKEKGIECDAFIYLEVPDEVLLERVTGRRLDPETNTIYHLKFKPPPGLTTHTRLPFCIP